jgi:hypothetical protein
MEQVAHIEQPGVLARRLAPQGYSSSRPGLDAEG